MPEGIAQRIGEFLRTRAITAKVQPGVKVDYHTYGQLEVELQKMWEALVPELEATHVIIDRKMNDYGSGYKYETIVANIDGVRVEISGPHYPAPTSPESDRANGRCMTQEEIANRDVDSILQQSSLAWALTNCSRQKADAAYAIISAAVGKRGADPEVVKEVTANVLSVLQIKVLTRD
jgi:hypothetical protein